MVKWLVDDLHVSPTEDARVLCIVALSAKPSEELFSYLVERGADPTHEDATLGTPLMLALQQVRNYLALPSVRPLTCALGVVARAMKTLRPG